MSVFARAAAATLVGQLALAQGAAAAPLLTSDLGGTCAMVTGPGTSSCAFFSIAPSSQTLTGSFGTDDDVAVLGFTLADPVFFSTSASVSVGSSAWR